MIQIREHDYLDLERLVSQLRNVTAERAAIPAHSGAIESSRRKQYRARRKVLSKEIDAIREQIVAWALSFIPVITEEELFDPNDPDAQPPKEALEALDFNTLHDRVTNFREVFQSQSHDETDFEEPEES